MALPDKEQIDSQVRHLAEEARDNPLTPTDHTRAAPIYMGGAHDVVPHRYVLHYSIVECLNCGTQGHESSFYALTYIKSRMNTTRVRQLIPCKAPLYNLPVDRIRTGHFKTPYCVECDTIDLSSLPPPPEEPNVYVLPEPHTKGTKPKGETKSKTATPKPAGLDELI
jgi:hypothetical protein